MKRRLAAILAADVAGYSRLMGENEAGTHAAFKGHLKDVIEPKFGEHHGRLVKRTGDGVLAEFASAVNAVECGVEIQRAMAARNSSVAKDERLAFRIGINIGDIIVEPDDIYGDGVNIAARLEGLAEPGGICVARNVVNQVKAKLDLSFEPLGEKQFKNIAEPIAVYSVVLDKGAKTLVTPGGRPRVRAMRGRRSAGDDALFPDQPCIAVLPFDNFSADQDQAFFADGITEDLITLLSKLEQLHVIARNSSFVYKGKPAKVQVIAKDLGVRYIVEGSVRRSRDRVRITAQLIDCENGRHLWSERYDRDLTDIFAVQDDISQEIVSAMALRLSPAEHSRIRAFATDNLEAYDTFLRGRDRFREPNKKANAEAQAMFQRALALDPSFAPAWAFLAFAHVSAYVNQWTSSGTALQEAYHAARRSVDLNENHPDSWVALGHASLWMRKHARATQAYQKAIAINPNYALGYAGLGWALNYAGKPEDSLPLIERSMRLDPHYPDWRLHWLGEALYNCGRYWDAAETLRRRLVRRPNSDVSHVLLAACYGQLGEADKAKAAWDAALAANPAFSLKRRRRILPYKDPDAFDRVLEGLRKAGLVDAEA